MAGISGHNFIDPDATWEPNVADKGEVGAKECWTAVYGDITDKVELEVKVEWERDDGETLETSFDVNVSDIPVPPISGGDSGSGGSSGGSW